MTGTEQSTEMRFLERSSVLQPGFVQEFGTRGTKYTEFDVHLFFDKIFDLNFADNKLPTEFSYFYC